MPVKKLILLLLFFTCLPIHAADKHKLAIIEFMVQGDSQRHPDAGKIISELLTTALVKTRRFDIVERSFLEKLLDEQKLSLTGVLTSQGSVEVGNLLDASMIASGSISLLKKGIEINCRIVDVEAGTILVAEQVSGNIDIPLSTLADDLAGLLSRHFPLKGQIIEHRAGTVIINMGTSDGVQPGMRFSVYSRNQRLPGRIIINRVDHHQAHGEASPDLFTALNVGQAVISTTDPVSSYSLMNGQWDAWSEDMASSYQARDTSGHISWDYQIKRINDDTSAGLTLDIGMITLSRHQLRFRLDSKHAHPVWITLYSFTPGFSKPDDEESLVAAEILVKLQQGENIITIDEQQLVAADWWLEEFGKPGIVFNAGDIRLIEFYAEVDDELGPIQDQLTIKAVDLLGYE